MDFKTFVFSVSFKYLFSLVLLSSRLYCRLWNLLLIRITRSTLSRSRAIPPVGTLCFELHSVQITLP